MADNVAVTAGAGTTVAADEVIDGTLGTVKVQYVKLMDGTLDGTSKAAVGANGLKVDGSAVTQPVSLASVPAHAVTQSGTWTVQPGNTANTTPWLSSISNTGGSAQAQVVANSDALANQVGVSANAQNQVYNGTTWDRLRGDTTAGMWAQIKAAIPAGTNLIGKIQLSDGTTALPILAGSSGSPATSAPAVAVSVRDANANGQTTMSASAPVAIASDQTIPIKAVTASSGATNSRVVAAATTNATNLKASAGNIFSIRVFNVAAYDVFLKLYNKASAPTVGTDTPVWTIPIKAGTGFSEHFHLGFQFGTGIAYAITKLQADTDTTAVAASDVTGTIGWI